MANATEQQPAAYGFIYPLRPAQFHFFDGWGGNYLSCNMYWAVGLECPHHKIERGATPESESK